MVLTQENINIREMKSLCGRFQEYVQVINGTPISVISFIHQSSYIPSLKRFM